jgi:type I restriction enzyme M protein
MNKTLFYKEKIKELIDELKAVTMAYGLGNDGNEYKIITQVFLYKFLNDKFIYEIKLLDKKLAKSKNLEKELKQYKKNDYEMLTMQLRESIPRLKPDQFISSLFEQQNKSNFANIFDNTMLDIAKNNTDIFSVKTKGGEKIILFENISKYVHDRQDEFCKALVNKLVNFSFEHTFNEKFDFYATIFEYLIKDYNTNSVGKYAEYFTPHAVAKIMASCLVIEEVKNITCHDPSAGSGTLLMNLAHSIGENKCSIYSQDISQKSSQLLRLNLILNNLVHSIPNIVQGNTILEPYYKESNGKLKQFDYIVSNPPFKLNFSDYRDDLDTKENHERFFAGIPKVPKKEKDKMSIYLLFFQHIMNSLTDKGRAAIVVPTGFITAQSGIAKKIRKRLVERKMLRGVVSMPSNIFAATGTSVSIVFIDNTNKEGQIILINASKLGETVKEGKNQKTLLSDKDEKLIINTFNKNQTVEDFSVVVSYEQIIKKNYSFSAGQYFDINIKYTDITPKKFKAKINRFRNNLDRLSKESKILDKEIQKQIKSLKHE